MSPLETHALRVAAAAFDERSSVLLPKVSAARHSDMQFDALCHAAENGRLNNLPHSVKAYVDQRANASKDAWSAKPFQHGSDSK